jgi:hypothetical protein
MELFSQEALAIIGLIALAFVVILVLMLLVGLIFAYAAFKNKAVVGFLYSRFGFLAIRVMLFILDLLYVPSRKIISLLGGNEKMIEVVNIELRNMLLKKSFSATPYADRLIVLPQCLRSLECPAKFSSIDGAKCAKCDKCKITSITKKAEEMGYKGVYIAPGGGFVKRILKKIKPKAVIGVGCPVEVYWGLQGVSDAGLIGYGVLLLRDGCVMTDIDLDELFTVMEMREHEPK